MSVQAYSAATTRAENPRSMEYRLFGQVTRALMDAALADVSDLATRIDAIDWNRRLWTTLANACSGADNGMDTATRAQIVSLSLFVNKHSSQVMRGKEDFDTLIEINKAIMQGLAGSRQAA